MATISVSNIRKGYRGKTVLRDVSFTVQNGDCIAVLGGNGTGKSTLLRTLAGVIPPDGGQFLWNEFDLMHDEARRTAFVGYVPQGTPLLQELSARDNLRLWYDRESLEQSLDAGVLKLLGVDRFLKTPVYRMSGGMKKRLSIGCAVAHDPRILLLDEPSAALDLVCKEHILHYLETFRKRGGVAILSTHDVQEIGACSACYMLRGGVAEPYAFDGDVERLVEDLQS
ncbi:MAG: ABC transporter ATP-binding protein [Oscillospiraceae bacterium]|nr:ABC transporter ATP-binding protein [Oscillospiraceae bacterium]